MSENNNFFQRFSNWLRRSLGVKIFSIGTIILVLMIPIIMVSELIDERSMRRTEAIREVSDKWGAPQVITGPVLTIPYWTEERKADGESRLVRRTLQLLPVNLEVDGTLSEEIRRRGLYEVILYNSELKLSGTFEKPNLAGLNIAVEDISWDQARLAIGISDMVGIENEMVLNWGGQRLRMEPGTGNQKLLPTGVSVNLPLSADEASFNFFEIDISLKGSDYLGFTPVGRQTRVKLSSGWDSPSFTGNFLPDQRNISEAGFSANWQVLDLNRNFPQQWIGDEYRFSGSDFGVRLLLPVDAYAKNERAVKYALFVIGLTFLLYFFFEILKKFDIHPFQYLLVGLALSLFYILLLSISEHLGFNLAYILAGAATIGLIVFYSAFVLQYRRLVFQLGLLLLLIYAFIFVVLQLEDFALLTGSIGLFLALATVMYLSRQVDWYGGNTKDEEHVPNP